MAAGQQIRTTGTFNGVEYGAGVSRGTKEEARVGASSVRKHGVLDAMIGREGRPLQVEVAPEVLDP